MFEIGMGLRLLETFTSALYEEPIVFFREYVQNSADAFISNPISNKFDIKIKIDSANRKIIFADNGYGIKYEEFYEKMTSIGKSEKNKSIDQIGFRGIGRLSAMPFCKRLIFKNKAQGHAKIQAFSWNGEKYLDLLSHSEDDDLSEAIRQITMNTSEPYNGDINDHYFVVEIESYFDEISELLESKDFKTKLCRLLPLKYNDDFIAQSEVHKHYSQFMGENLQKYEFDVLLDGEHLYKPYNANHVLESDIVFWDLVFESTSKNISQEKIGILWFTFNRKVTSNPQAEPRGILVRSKNMLLGSEYALADAVTKSSGDYVATYRELTQTLNGVYGELLVDTTQLSDNARRDWFKIDNFSIQLRIILADFLKKLKTYRYAASLAFNDKKAEKKREDVIRAYEELTKGFDAKTFEKEFFTSDEQPAPQSGFLYAEDDIPRYSITIKKFYEQILKALREYFTHDTEDRIDSFIKIRTYLKQSLNKKDD